MESQDERHGFAPDYDVPIPYMQRTRDYYAAIGYAPYRWAHYTETPFTQLRKPLSQTRVTIVTTAAPFNPDKGDQGPRASYNAAPKFYEIYAGDTSQKHDLRISHIAYDRKHTSAEDSGTWFPLPQLLRLRSEGRIGLAPNFFGMPTNRSHRVTIEKDVPELVVRCQADNVGAVVLVPNCPVCHQTTALAARGLEVAGIPAVVLGCAKDIVEHVGVPRFVFSDFPLGNSAGKPNEPASQAFTFELALRLLEKAPDPNSTVQSPLRWSADPSWKLDYNNVERIAPEELARRKREFEEQKIVANKIKASAA